MTQQPSQPQPDGPALPADGIDLKTYLAFLGLEEGDRRRLKGVLPLYGSQSAKFVESFYRHLLSFEQTARFLRDPDVVEHLKQLQQAHWRSTLQSEWDEQFVSRRMAVGRAHAVRGVEPLLYLGSNYRFVEFLVRAVSAEFKDDPHKTTETILSILKAVFLDASLSLESYFAKMTEDLRRALDMVWKANEKLRQFARLSSHDMKTPLATVANLCDEVLDEFGQKIPPEARELIQSAQQTIYRMADTIDELLSASLTTEEDPAAEEVDPREIVQEALARVQPELDKRHIDVTVADQMPMVVGNRYQIREAFYNLLSNAAKYIDKTPGRIEIGVAVESQECHISFADNGPGIPAEELSHVFTAFRRLTMHGDQPGSGLGLYFAKRLVEHQGGRMWVESEPGKGSCFYVALRLAGSGWTAAPA